MANIRVDLSYAIKDGSEIKFRSPVDCSVITGLIVYYPGEDGDMLSNVFALADAHGNNVGDIDHLFAEDVVVKVILDVTKGMAFVQNADTNAYLEAQLASKAPAGYGLGVESKMLTSADDLNNIKANGWYRWYMDDAPANAPVEYAWSPFQCCRVWTLDGGVCIQEIVELGHNPQVAGVKIQRTIYGPTAQPWECENPPMFVGVEYRTTDRWNVNGVPKPLYVKALNIDSVENRLTIEPSGWGQIRVIEIVGEATLSDGYTIMIPGRYADTEAYFEQSYGYSSAPRLIVTDGFPIIGRPLNVRLKYWKTTD